MRPRLLDLFCGAGGAAMGYHRAGFDVVGVDNRPQPNYPFEFYRADALDWMRWLLDAPFLADVNDHGERWVELREFDAIHASPPCQAYTRAQNAAKNAHAHPDLVGPVRELLETTGLPYVIENVVGAPLRDPVMVCGLSLGLNVRRHRLFESNVSLMVPPCSSHDRDYYVIFGHEVRNRRHGAATGRKNKIAEGRKAMGIDWMARGELSEAIPPAYTELIGAQLLAHIQAAVA